MEFRSLIKMAYFMILRCLPKRLRLQLNFLRRQGYWPDLDNPNTFSERLLTRALQGDRPDFSRWADKIEAKHLVRELVGDRYLIPTLWTGDQIGRPAFESLPAPFVLKATNASGANAFVWSEAEKVYERVVPRLIRQRDSFISSTEEAFYRTIPARFIAEPLLTDLHGKVPNDLKFHVFGGEVLAIQVDMDRFGDHRRNFYDPEWRRLDLSILYPNATEDAPRPQALDEMLDLARRLSSDFDYVRVDLYELAGRPLFGELTFVHGGGYEVFTPRSLDREWGELWGRARACL